MARVLVVDEAGQDRDQIVDYIRGLGHGCSAADILAEGLAAVTTGGLDMVVLESSLLNGESRRILARFRDALSRPELVLLTRGDEDARRMETSLQGGAGYCLQKPFPMSHVKLLLGRILESRQTAVKPRQVFDCNGMVGSSPVFLSCLETAARAAQSQEAVLITGETGTGKGMLARLIHANSLRREGPFVVLDCTAIPASLLESTLFGHAKGAFTGASRDHAGVIRQAHGGTLFLDEVGELPPSVQAALLRVLQEKRFRPVGARREVEVDFRLVAATNCNLAQMVREGRFRKDLFYRLHAFPLHLPPLRERLGDIKSLAAHFISRACEERGLDSKGYSREFIAVLKSWDWEGNVRELIHVLGMAVINAHDESKLLPRHLPTALQKQQVCACRSWADSGSELDRLLDHPGHIPTLKDFREAVSAVAEKKYLARLIVASQGRCRKALELSGMSKGRLYQLLTRHGMRLRPVGDSPIRLTNK